MLLGGVGAGTYQLTGLLARGANGDVHTAERVDALVGGTPAVCVVKVLNARMRGDAELVARLQREWRVIGSLQHPNIVTLIDQGEDPVLGPFVVMPFLPGRNLGQLIAQGPVPWPTVRDVGVQTLLALQAAHDQRVIHRDLKPENLQVDYRKNGEVHVWLMDFGLAKVLESSGGAAAKLGRGELLQTRQGQVIGSPAYMSPEQVLASPPDERSDLYALGVLLFEALTGTLPFEGESAVAQMSSRLCGSPKAPSAVAAWIPPELDVVIMSMLQPDRALRPTDAAAALQRWQAAGRAGERAWAARK